MKHSIQNNARILTLFAIACTAIVSLVHLVTKDRIEIQKQQYLLKTLNAIVAPEIYNNVFYQDCVFYHDENNIKQTAYLARFNGEIKAAALTATAPDGYNGNIELLVAINIDLSVSGVRVLNHKETPGLGDKIELRKSAWIENFNDKTVEDESDNRWTVAKDGGMFDQFTGATITPRAVITTVKRTALYFAKNKDELISKSDACGGTDEVQ